MSKTNINFNRTSKESFRNTLVQFNNNEKGDFTKIYNIKNRDELDQGYKRPQKKHLHTKLSPPNLSTRDDSMHSSVMWLN